MPRGLIEVTDINISEDGSMFPDSGREFIRRDDEKRELNDCLLMVGDINSALMLGAVETQFSLMAARIE